MLPAARRGGEADLRAQRSGRLDRKLAALDPGLPKLVVFESAYSMDGDIAPIGELCDVATAHGAMTYLDEVHASDCPVHVVAESASRGFRDLSRPYRAAPSDCA